MKPSTDADRVVALVNQSKSRTNAGHFIWLLRQFKAGVVRARGYKPTCKTIAHKETK